jgi:uncharacterized protein (TIGR03086 family)
VSASPSSAPSAWGGVELLERAIGYTRGSLALVTPALMDAPSPCAVWDLRALLRHMQDSLMSLLEAGAARRVRMRAPGTTQADPVAELRSLACDLLAEWSTDHAATPVGARSRDVVVDGFPLTPPVLTSTGALEVAVHGWDVAAACGVRRVIPADLATALLAVAPVVVTESDRPARFAPPVDPRPDAVPGERLVAFLGRDPWTKPAC